MGLKLGPENLQEPILRHAQRTYTRLRKDQTVREVLESLRGADLAEKIVYFYVVDEDGRLAGVVPTRRLLMSAAEQSIAEIMVPRVVAIRDTATVLEACEQFLEHRFLALPVVNDEGKMLGVVDVGVFTDEVMILAEQRSAENVFQLIGVHVDLGRRVSSWVSFKDRFPWLLCNITGGILCAFLAGAYSSLLDSVMVLAWFIPVVLALAESVSIQSLTLTLRSLQSERTLGSPAWSALRKEFITAALLGLAAGAIVAGVMGVWHGRMPVVLVVWISICLSVVAACLLGVAIPTVVRALRFDPRIAAGPITLAIADLGTLLIYFSAGHWLLDRT